MNREGYILLHSVVSSGIRTLDDNHSKLNARWVPIPDDEVVYRNQLASTMLELDRVLAEYHETGDCQRRPEGETLRRAGLAVLRKIADLAHVITSEKLGNLAEPKPTPGVAQDYQNKLCRLMEALGDEMVQAQIEEAQNAG